MSVYDAYPHRGSEPELRTYYIRILGAGAADPTLEEPGTSGITPAWSATGTYTLTWADNPGTFINSTYMIGAATPGDVAGHTVIRDTFASQVFTFVLYNASDAAHDLAANEYIDLAITFQMTSA